MGRALPLISAGTTGAQLLCPVADEATSTVGTYTIMAFWAQEVAVVEYLTLADGRIETTPEHQVYPGAGLGAGW